MKRDEIQLKMIEEMKKLDWSMSPQGLYEPISYILSLGGKRVRPLLALMGCDMFGGNIQEAMPAALAIEIFHNFTLLHDDLMDNADIRRGQKTVHIKWDENTAILSGDVMQTKAFQMLGQVPEKHLKTTLDLFSTMACEICEGQQYDMEFEKREDVTAGEYINMIRLKTAVLLGTALKIGALIGGGTLKEADTLYDFGINVGLAFQLKDDLLDVYGNPETFGKKIGGDIISNKKTYMLIMAQQMAKGDIKEELQQWISASDFDPEEKIKSVTKIYNTLGINKLCEEKMDEFFNIAIKNLDQISTDFENKQNLYTLARSLMKREL